MNFIKQTLTTLTLLCAFAISSFAADDPSIPKTEKAKIQQAMKRYIQAVSHKKKFPILHPKSRTIVQLKLKALHKGVFRKGRYFASCADFVNKAGVVYDVDFLVHKAKSGRYQVVHALIHKKQGKKWPYKVQR